ncbi:sugar porter family MFS transporter [Paenibacillus sacheonensis]|uniref:Sugar porter family MFS transporter n=1 Tax=Paenibacillus sacheonensis TaxID=742054 RepID=A0A7X4YTM9_9BACL|nr:sugar porter family MFS transporter [Paenibacillus sacheonensis]MBM7567563.1 SP family arabinose:H+ symporter-like MFS transporter [Paenibacillus sacheonensis]NBC71334.1 sugar porter family MFS transporter [Paenibacillus sacheonensis]
MTTLRATASGPSMRFVTLVSMIAALGGLLFGFDTAVVSGAIGFMQDRFDLSEFEKGWAVSSLIIGCIVGAAASGWLSDGLGRKKVLIGAALLFIIGSIFSATPDTFTGYVMARMVGGLGIGITSTLCPLYNAEIAPARYRGRLVAFNQFAVVTGIFITYFINSGIAGSGGDAWDVSTAWRWMFGIGAIPGVVFMVLMFLVPESPRWLIKQGRAEEALAILLRIHGEEAAKQEVLEIKASFAQKQARFGELFKPGVRFALFVGVVIAVLQQVTGINAIMYYAPEILKSTGAGTNAALIQTILVGFINFIFTILSIWLIDKAGRKALLLVGSSLMTASLLAIGIVFHTGHATGSLVLVLMLVYVAAFAISLGPVVWVLLSEIFPNRIRGRATAIASMALWAADYAVSQSFPPLLDSAGPAATYWIFGALSLVTVLFTWRFVPETKGKSLEEIEHLWDEQGAAAQARARAAE